MIIVENIAMTDIPKYTISNAAELLSISVHTMRMYEREGLIIPHKKPSGQRLYSDRDIERLSCVRRAINQDKISIEGIKRILSLVPCWGIVNCPTEDRDNCTAFKGHAQPCWMLKHKDNYCANKECRECEVYQNYGDCRTIKQSLKELIKL